MSIAKTEREIDRLNSEYSKLCSDLDAQASLAAEHAAKDARKWIDDFVSQLIARAGELGKAPNRDQMASLKSSLERVKASLPDRSAAVFSDASICPHILVMKEEANSHTVTVDAFFSTSFARAVEPIGHLLQVSGLLQPGRIHQPTDKGVDWSAPGWMDQTPPFPRNPAQHEYSVKLLSLLQVKGAMAALKSELGGLKALNEWNSI